MGGISGNAGLFANTKSIFPLAKMLMQDGLYDEKRYLNSETISLFTKGPPQMELTQEVLDLINLL